MTQQRWFAGLPFVAERSLAPEEYERLAEVASAVRSEALTSYVLLVLSVSLAVSAPLVDLTSGYFGFAVLGLTTAALRYLPQRRFFAPRTILGLRRDLRVPVVYICESDDVKIEVLSNSHLIWTRNSQPSDSPVVVHDTATAPVPEHALYAANFVRPVDGRPELRVHQRVLTSAELDELDSSAPRVNFALIVLAFISLAGGLATFTLLIADRLGNPLPFVLIGVGIWASDSIWLATKARNRIAPDLEAGYAVIVRVQEAEGLGPPQEVLPFSNLEWTHDGLPAHWRRQL